MIIYDNESTKLKTQRRALRKRKRPPIHGRALKRSRPRGVPKGTKQ